VEASGAKYVGFIAAAVVGVFFFLLIAVDILTIPSGTTCRQLRILFSRASL
jgi:hypothetical protein